MRASWQQPLRLVPFPALKALGTIPRYPDHSSSIITYDTLSQQELDSSFIVFVSHGWVRAASTAEDWDGKPHPDTKENNKYHLIINGIQKILDTLTDGITNCYVWLDFACLDQDDNPVEELEDLKTIIEISDIVFTPIYDPEWSSRLWPMYIYDYLEDYVSPSWTGTPTAYLNRSWCRVEMFFASNLPLRKDDEERQKRFKGSLLSSRRAGRRVHFLYGTQQEDEKSTAILLDPLSNKSFEKYHPNQGNVTHESDREKIHELVQELLPLLNEKPSVGYFGDVDEDGRPHGRGRYCYENGDVYLGEWKKGERHGKGRHHYISNDVYEGDWVDGVMEGKGKYLYASGDMYEGDWKSAMMHGYGTFRYTDGNIYEGQYYESARHGQGKDTYANGNIYEGGYQDDDRHGIGKMTIPSTGAVMYRLYRKGEMLQESTSPF